jgi:hypothetical protein
MKKKKAFSLLLIVFLITASFIQNGVAAPVSDSSSKVKHYTKFDSSMFHFSNETKLGRFIFKNLYRQPQQDVKPIDNMQSKQKQDRINRYEGKIIRNVYYKTLDPFGTEVDDTLILRRGFIEDIGNKVNLGTRQSNIQSLILFKKGDKVDPLRVKESERLLRRQEYIRDARIIVPAKTKRNADSIDLIVVVQDRWSINASVGASTTSSDFRITESNLLGTGSRITQAGQYDITKGKFSNWQGELSDNNIKNTYIDGKLFYNISPLLRFHGINFNRTFFSPLTKWAGSAGISRFNENKEYTVSDGIIIPAKLIYNVSDVWLGRSLKINQNEENGRTNSLVLGTRYVKTDYIERPDLLLDTLDSFRDVDLYLFSLGFSSRRYYKDKKIYRFGNTEDIPEGRSFNAIFGILDEEKTEYIYNALRYSAGQHIMNFGYLSGSVQYGVFYNNYIASRGVFNVDVSYFSDLWSRGKWNMRQFVYFQVTNGLNRLSTESVTLNGRGTEGLYGFNSFSVLGKNKTLLKLESIIYTPFNFAGVQVASVVFAGFGKIGSPLYANLNPNTIYQAYGLGLLLRKENLVVNTIQITLGFYPNIPTGTGTNFKFNPIGINNLNLKDFDVSKPELINYR